MTIRISIKKFLSFFQRMVLLKGLCLEEDNDDSLVPRKLFLFKIEDFQKGPQVSSVFMIYERSVEKNLHLYKNILFLFF